MSDKQLLELVEEAQISLELDGESLVVKGGKGRVNDKVKSYLIENKANIIDILKSGLTLDGRNGIRVPRNAIEPSCAAITSQMLPLIDLSQEDIDRIVAQVPGGVDNIQDIYALTHLQDGILFHHRLATEGDPYLLISQIAFPDKERLDHFLSVVQQVVDRHDVLRTAFFWEGLSNPAQVVWRQARLSVVEVALDPQDGPVAEQLRRRFDPRRHRVDLTSAPLLNYVIAHDAENNRWLAMQRFHHLAGDHSTLDLLRSEIYALHAHPERKLPPAEPFRNVIAQMRLGFSQEKHEDFFRAMLGNIDEPTVAFGHADVYLQGDNIAESRRMLPHALHERLRAQVRRNGVSVASLCHLAWGQVLARSVGKESAVFGTVLLGRLQANDFARRAAGLCINSLPFRIDLSEKSTASVVRETHARLCELLLHEHASLALAQRCSGVTGKTPLFNALLNYRHVIEWQKGEEGMNGDRSLAGVELLSGEERTNYPITLSVDDYGYSLGLTAQAIQPLSPDRICGYMQQALESLVAALETSSETSIRALNVLPEEERRLQLETWNATAAEYPQDRCIHELFEEQVRKSPEARAVVHEDRVLSYSELNAQANRLAHYLIGLGVGPDDRVAICVERSAAMVIGLLAILKAGGAYVPLDPAYPSERLSQIVGDAAPSLLLIDAAGRAALGGAASSGWTLVDLEPLRQGEGSATAWSSQPAENAQVPGLTSRHLAYVIYTSGSTGTPKGVMNEHRALINRLLWMQQAYGLDSTDVVLQKTTFSFDVSVWEFFWTLQQGATLLVPAPELHKDPAGLIELMVRAGVTTAHFVPSMLDIFLMTRGVERCTALRRLICSGEALPAAYVQACREKLPGAQLHNLYGPTEAAVDVTAWTCPPSFAGGVVPIGRPIANTRIYLLDEQGQPALLGATGELYIGGDGIARGYFNRPELTAERFLKDPFSPHPEARMYRTGDLARYLPDGNIEYLGRNDFQVKIRGFRIELGEIEARLSQHALVREAVVEARDAGEEKRLAAYVIPAEETIETDELVAALRAYLATTLPDYMVPSAFVRMAAWPLTPNGKLDRKALPAPDDEAYVRREYEAPQGEIEQTLAGLWRELLQIERIGRQDDFFELGGHSLTATRLLARIRQALGVELPVATVFARPTLMTLAQAVAEASATAQAVLPMARISREEPMPLSFAQQRLWFLAQLEGVSATYHIPLALRLRGALDRAALCRALDTVLARHEGLRSVFVAVDGEPQVRLLPETTGLPLIEHDLRGHENASVELARLGKEEARAPFDLAQGPLIRSRLVQLADDDHVLLLTQHHIVSDGWSIGVLSRELTTLYQAFQQGQANPLPPLTIQYPDYAAWQRGWLSGERLERQTAYWREALTGAPALLELPTDRPRPAQPDHSGARVPIVLDAELTRSLKQLSQRHGTTLFMTVLAAWAVVLSRLSGQDEVVIGTPTANRGRVETEGLIGFFVNTLALRIQLDESPSVSELLSRARKFALAAQEHQDLPFEQVVEIVQPPRRLDQNPIFQVLFNWRNNEVSLPEFAGVQVTLPVTGYEVLKFDLELSLSELNEQIVGSLAYATALFDATTIERHVGYLQAALRAMVSNSEQRVAAIELLSEEERRLQLETWNATAAEYPQDRCIHELFEEQVRKSPEARAVVHEDRVLSYSELNAQANRLAHYLIGLGVGPDDRVAICVERSAAMVIGLLAILKAGGAYVPLDPAYPSERLSQIVGDAAPSLLLIDAAGRAALGGAASSGWTLVDLEPLRQGEGSATAWSSQPAENAQVPGLTSRHLAYVIYTSGSTGTPKGVMNEHRALINRLLWMQQAYGLDSTDVVLQKTTFSFDVSVWEFFWTLQQGATLLVPAPELHKDPAGLIELMVRAGVTTAHFVPSMLDIFLMTRGVERCTALRRLICSGEALPAAYVQACREKLPGAQLHNLYGPTEAAVDVTAWTCPPSFAGGVVPIGRPIANTRIYLLDEQGQPALLGATGELYIGGDGIARGYFNRPELTAERFLKDPFSPHPEARMYRTGDLARYLPDGNIEYLGRNDFQVKIRGFRIELGEIEARLSQHALVREAVVEARDAGEEKRLAAYVIPAEETIETDELVAALRAYLATTLPDYMVPSAFVRMAAWPLTPNGKLDRKALPAPDDEAYVRREYEAPQGEIEQTLAGLWRELLQIERIGRQDDFFELGGHSLLLVQLVERLRRFNLKADIRRLFATPVLYELAAALERDRGIIVPPNLITPESDAITPEMLPLIQLNQEDINRIVKQVPGGTANIQDIYSLAPLQEGILFHHRLTGEDDPYLLRSIITFANRELLDRFLDAVQQIVDRHDIFRTAFIWKGLSTPAQVVWRKAKLSVTELELDAQDGPIDEQLTRRFNAGHHRIDLSQAPLASFVIAREPDGLRWQAMHLVHHLLEDALSIRIAREEILKILEGNGATLPPPPAFRNLVAEALLGSSPEEHERFFRKMLGDVSEPTLPFGLTDVHSNGEHMSQFKRMLPQKLNDRLRSQARRLRMGLASLCHLAWGQVLARIVGNERVVFGTVLFGRLHAGEGASRATGMLMNTLPLRLDLGEIDIESATRQANDRLAELMVHEQASLVIAQRCSGIEVPTPLFSSLLNYRNVAFARPRDASSGIDPLAGLQWRMADRYNNYPLLLDLEDSGHSLICMIHIMRPQSPERVWNYMQQALESLVDALETSPETPMRALNVLPLEERRLQLETWNATAAEYPQDRCIHELIEEQVRKSPEAPAVVHEDRVLSYAELNAEANRLAHHLIELGVGPDDRVAICVERSAVMVIGLLAILKAGGAYVPLDPAYPSKRLSQIVGDTAPSMLLIDAVGRAALRDADSAVQTLVDLEPLHKGEGSATAWSSQPGENVHVPALTSRHLAYVIYTSGSTGTPKGVMVEHRGVVNFLCSMAVVPGITAQDRLLAVTTISFDIAGLELYLPLSHGAQIIVASRRDSVDPHALQRLMKEHGITMMQATPATWRALLDAQWRPSVGLKILCGGEALPTDLSARLVEQGESLWNLYGPTETTIWSACVEIERGGGDATVHASIGRPIGNTQIYLLDEQRQPVPQGAVGEIYIGGAGVTRGYLNRPELTAERFVLNPFSVAADARMYRTGDLARYLADGNIEFLGRNDQQVKIRGYRIELGEIEAQLAEYPGVREAVVVAREHAPDDKRLVGYLVPQPLDEFSYGSSSAIGTTFSMFYFGAESGAAENKYELYLKSAKFADENHFEAVWTPERHFHNVGQLYPNPATLSAALATITTNLKLRAGSVVLPLHDPIRVAEEWAIVDNLSNGRVGIAAASGWHPRDFSIIPENYSRRREAMQESIQALQTLWRGETITRLDGNGKETQIQIFPKPIQPELPLWITAAGNPQTFVYAGKIGANILTHLLGQTISELGQQIAQYRAARAEAGHDPESGRVTVMIHAFLGEDFHEALSRSKAPFMHYMQEHLGLAEAWAKSLGVNIDDLLDQDKNLAEFAFERYTRTASLIGTPKTCLSVANQLQGIGVNEIACLIDWMDAENALKGLPYLKQLYDLTRASFNRDSLRTYLSSRLPEYMVPAAFVQLEELPLTPNGKVDRKALPAPEGEAYAQRIYEPPQGEIEESLANLWQELLRVERVGRHDNFFDLGGHSLLAVRMLNHLFNTLNVEIEISTLFNYPQLALFAKRVLITSIEQEFDSIEFQNLVSAEDRKS